MNSATETFARHLKQRGLRLTSERQCLLEVILSIKGHFSPEELLTKVKVQKAPVSRATIYRILPVLVEAELIQQSLLTTEDQTHFEVTWNKAHHDHLICTICKKIIEFQHNAIEVLQREVANKYGFILDHHIMELMGRCRECRKI